VPWALLAALAPVWWAVLLVPAVLLVLVAVATRLWSPVVVLGAAILSLVGAAAFFLVTVVGEACGGSGLADAISWAGAVPLAVAIGAWGIRRGFLAYAAIPAGWIAAAVWFVVVAHVVHGGARGCLE
jgi:hypothetical protein